VLDVSSPDMSSRTPADTSGRKTLSLPVIHILLSLVDGERHGYAIKQAVEERTAGSIRLGPGTLYEAIQRLEESGLIAESSPPPAANGQEAQRRYYTLTTTGWSALQFELRQLGDLLEHARRHPRLRKGLA
jgi:DNA-binding PadR family transcriptional regulator